jgi:hypothetical protein
VALRESEIVSVAVRAPDAEGVNSTLTVQLADGARLAPHVVLAVKKSPELVPESAVLPTVTAMLLPLVIVTGCGAVVEPSVVLANVRLVGDTVTLPVIGTIPVPDSVT